MGESPFSVMQLLWINLIMDILGAIALATEPPKPDTLTNREIQKDDREILPAMKRSIYTQVLY